MKFSFVLLHYNTIQDTTNLVSQIDSFFENSKHELNIAIVDNASKNNTGTDLKKMYKNSKNIEVILSPENLGFANGNNLGYRYCLENYNPDFIILSNTDIELLDIDMLEKTIFLYEKYNFAVMGPNIIKPTVHGNIYQNPYFYGQKITPEFVKNEIKRIRSFESKKILKLKIKKILKIKSKPYIPNSILIEDDLMDYVTLSGAFLVFSKKYINLFPNGLAKETFMYGEEHFLSYFCQKNGLRIIYSPMYSVNHLEGRATLTERNEIQRSKFLKQEATKSLQKLLKIIKDDE
ncbi:glycosyltransferase [Enterococcus sp. AZ102]|uniref:glycosyltransferase n=1 Tax=Enterococcus sp. AZ102 TaxID=2774865 RepID=UPI003F1E8C95